MEFERDFDLEIGNFGIQKVYSLTWDHGYGGTVACLPEMDEGIVYFGCDNYYFYALDAETGKEIWKFKSGGCAGNYPPTVVGDFVFFGSYDGYLYKLKKKTGELAWIFKTGGKVVSGIAHSDGKIVFGSRDSNVYCLDTEGKEIWRFRTGDQIISTPSISDGKVYIGSYDGCMYCLDLETGKELWRFRTGGAIGNMDPINIHEDKIFFGSWDLNMYCIDRFRGKEIWRHRAGKGILSCGSVHNGILYFGSRMDYLHAVDINTGKEVWKIKAEGHTHASNVSIFKNRVYFGGGEEATYKRGFICCANTEGGVLWNFITNGPSWAGPNMIKGMLFAGAWNGYIYRLDPDTGEVIWEFRTSGSPSKEKVTDFNEFAVITIITGEGVFTEKEKEEKYSQTPEIQVMENVYVTKSEYSAGPNTYKSETGYK